MTECICEVGRYGMDFREPVVRCRDCAYASHDGTRCHYWSSRSSAWAPRALPDVDPKGFCAWGEKVVGR